MHATPTALSHVGGLLVDRERFFMTLLEKISADFVSAMKARDERKKTVLSFLRSAMKNAEIEKHAPLTDSDIEQIITRDIKRRHESLSFMEQGNRVDAAAEEREQIAVLQSYLPAQLTDEEVERQVRSKLAELGAIDPKAALGKVMGALKPALGSSVDGARLNAIVRRVLEVS